MLLVLQAETRQEIWYDRVWVQEVPLVVEEHLLSGRPVADMLYRAKHPRRSSRPGHPYHPPGTLSEDGSSDGIGFDR